MSLRRSPLASYSCVTRATRIDEHHPEFRHRRGIHREEIEHEVRISEPDACQAVMFLSATHLFLRFKRMSQSEQSRHWAVALRRSVLPRKVDFRVDGRMGSPIFIPIEPTTGSLPDCSMSSFLFHSTLVTALSKTTLRISVS